MNKSKRLEPPWGAILCTTSAPWLRNLDYTLLYSIVEVGIDEIVATLGCIHLYQAPRVQM